MSLEEKVSKMLEGSGPVPLGIAATNRPHLPLPPMSIVEIEGQKFIRTPFLVAGTFKHPDGDLIFNDEVFQRMLENHANGISHYGVSLDIKHQPDLGALAWYDKSLGGFIKQEEDPKHGKMLVGYGLPTSDDAVDIIESGKYRYASVEFVPNYSSNVVERFSSDDLIQISLEEFLQEDSMPKKNEDGTVLLSVEEAKEVEGAKEKVVELENQVKTLKTSVTDVTKKLEEATTKITGLESSDDDKEEVPDHIRVLLENRDKEIASMQQRMLRAEVASVIERAKALRDDSGRAHSPVLLEWAENLMLGQPLGKEEKVIKLEDASSIGSIIGYVNKAVSMLLETLPGQVPVKGNTQFEENPMSTGATTATKEDYAGFWGKKEE